jgi:hypothetical protein
MVFNAIFNNISIMSWWSVLLVDETRVPRENHDLPQVADKLYHNVVWRTPRHERHSKSQLYALIA